MRSILGFQIDPRDDRFKEALLQKEREEKKAKKAARKLVRQQRMMDRLRLEVDSPPTPVEDITGKSDTKGGVSNISPGSPIV